MTWNFFTRHGGRASRTVWQALGGRPRFVPSLGQTGGVSSTVSVTPSPLVPTQPDLALTKRVSNATPNVGDTISFTVTLTNNGPADATNVQVTDLLPAGVSFVWATPAQGSYVSATGLWTVGSVANGASTTLTRAAPVQTGL